MTKSLIDSIEPSATPKPPAAFPARRSGPPQSRGPILGRGKGGGVGGKGRIGMRTGTR